MRNVELRENKRAMGRTGLVKVLLARPGDPGDPILDLGQWGKNMGLAD